MLLESSTFFESLSLVKSRSSESTVDDCLCLNSSLLSFWGIEIHWFTLFPKFDEGYNQGYQSEVYISFFTHGHDAFSNVSEILHFYIHLRPNHAHDLHVSAALWHCLICFWYCFAPCAFMSIAYSMLSCVYCVFTSQYASKVVDGQHIQQERQNNQQQPCLLHKYTHHV